MFFGFRILEQDQSRARACIRGRAVSRGYEKATTTFFVEAVRLVAEHREGADGGEVRVQVGVRQFDQ